MPKPDKDREAKLLANMYDLGCLGGLVVEHLPSAQVMILGPRIESHIRLPAWSLLLPLPVTLPLSLSLMNK